LSLEILITSYKVLNKLIKRLKGYETHSGPLAIFSMFLMKFNIFKIPKDKFKIFSEFSMKHKVS